MDEYLLGWCRVVWTDGTETSVTFDITKVIYDANGIPILLITRTSTIIKWSEVRALIK